MDKKTALAQLRQSRFVYERGVERQEAERRAKLHRFLDQHRHSSQWATSLAALEDAVRHGVAPNDAALCTAMYQCGQRGQLSAARHIYTNLYRRVGRPRPLRAHVAFMAACADAGDFPAARQQFLLLRERDVARHAANPAHQPVVNDDLTTEYLRAALAASVSPTRQSSHTAGAASIPVADVLAGEAAAGAAKSGRGPSYDAGSDAHKEGGGGAEQKQGGEGSDAARGAGTTPHRPGRQRRGAGSGARPAVDASDPAPAQSTASVEPPWQVALADLVALRQDAKLFRRSHALTPLLLETATQLACVGRQWQLCLALLRGAAAEQALIPPEAYDAAIRACYQAQQHRHVVRLMEQLIATRVPPDERSVRLALVSAEEVSARERALQAVVVPSTSPSPGADAAGSSASSALVGQSPSWSMALTLFHALERNGFPLYQQSYEAPLRACVNAGRWKEAFEMVQAMRRDHRPVAPPTYALALSARIEAATSWSEVQRLLRASALADGHASVVVLYLAALRACMRQRDWPHFAVLNREMRDRDLPETYDKMRLLIEAAYLQGQYHSVLMRFARFENITQFERRRVVKDQLVRLYEADFELSSALLAMVLDAYTHVKGHADPAVEAAYQAALRWKERQQGGQGSLAGAHTAPDEWMYSQAAREARAPPDFH